MNHAAQAPSASSSASAPPLEKDPQLPLPADWDRMKDVIHSLYIGKKLPLKDVRAKMERDHSFKATERMFKTRLQQWGFLKKMRDIDWQAVAVLHKQRQKLGRRTSAFKVHGRKIKQADLRKYLKDREISEEDLLAEAAANDITCQNIPDHISCFTPTVSSDPASPGRSSSQNSSTTDRSPTKGLLGTNISGSNPPAMSESAWPDAFYIVDRPRSASSETSSSKMSSLGLPAPDMRRFGEEIAGIGSTVALHDLIPLENEATFCDQVQQDLGLLLVRGLTPDSLDLSSETTFIEPWTFLNPPDDTGSSTVVCPKCHAQISNHLPFPSNFILGKESFMPHSMFFHDMHLESPISHDAHLASVWMACCFGACIFVRRQDFDYVAKSLSQADSAFEEMLRTQNSALLTSLNSTLTILNAHDQSKMEMSVVRSALHVAHKVLGTEDPISVALEWMTAQAWRKLPQCRVTTKDLTAIYNQFHSQYGPKHPHTLAILYNVGFSLLRDKLYEEAESHLRKLYEDSRLTLGPSHIQTITALATLSRALSNQKKFEEAVELRKQAVGLGQRTLGQNHPHTLESMRRLALIYKDQGKDDLMEPIYWAVLQGRIKSLGPKHDYTEGAREDLIELLKKLNKWDEHGEGGQSRAQLVRTAQEKQADKEFFIDLLSSAAIKRDAKAYITLLKDLNKATTDAKSASPKSAGHPVKSLPRPKSISETSMAAPELWRRAQPSHFRKTLPQWLKRTLKPGKLHVALVKLVNPELLDEWILQCIGQTLGQLSRLSISPYVVVDTDTTIGTVGHIWRQNLSTKPSELWPPLTQILGQAQRELTIF